MNISANSLFHFTRKRENLINIIKNGFFPSYCIENIDFDLYKKIDGFISTDIAFPMVCFCDIPLAQIQMHVHNFGGYAIGLTKEWGEQNGINPVMYELPDSNPIKIIKDCLMDSIPYAIEENCEENEEKRRLNEIGNRLIFFLKYLKPYKGRKWNGEGFYGEEIRFYNEKEWRYIPDYYKMREKDIQPFLKPQQYLDGNVKNQFNSKIQNAFKLLFTYTDIKYIIVQKEDEVQEIIRDIEFVKEDFNSSEIKLLLTKILSLDRLKEDF